MPSKSDTYYELPLTNGHANTLFLSIRGLYQSIPSHQPSGAQGVVVDPGSGGGSRYLPMNAWRGT